MAERHRRRRLAHGPGGWLRRAAAWVTLTLSALLVSLLLFGGIIALAGVDVGAAYAALSQGAVAAVTDWRSTGQHAAPLMLTALCVALPARLGLLVVGGEGALALGGVAALSTGMMLLGAPVGVTQLGMTLAAMATGGIWTALAGGLRYYRGVNETLGSLILAYAGIAIAECILAASSPVEHAAARHDLAAAADLSLELLCGVTACILAHLLIQRTPFGFAVRAAGGNPRAARSVGLPLGRLVLLTCFIGGAAAGLAGLAETATLRTMTDRSLLAGYGCSGIVVAFIARHQPLAIIPAALLLGVIKVSTETLQFHSGLPDTTMLVLQAIVFTTILAGSAVFDQRQPATEP